MTITTISGMTELACLIAKELIMKAKITAKSELRWPELVRDYTFDIITTDNETLFSSSVVARPSEITSRLAEIVAEYQAAFEDQNDVEIGTEIS